MNELCFVLLCRDFLTTADLPHEIQHFLWAPEGNQLVIWGVKHIFTLTDYVGLQGIVMHESVKGNLFQTLMQNGTARKGD